MSDVLPEMRALGAKVMSELPAFLLVLLATALGQAMTLSQHPVASFTNDTPGYVLVAQQILQSPINVIQPARTPGYPLFLDLVFLLSGGINFTAAARCTDEIVNAGCSHLFVPVVIAQVVIMLVATIELYVLLRRLSLGPWATALTTIFATVNLYSLSWERTIMTESLSAWSLVTVALAFERYLRKPSVRTAVTLAVWLFISIMIRPSNEFFPVILIAVVMLFALRTRNVRAWVATASLVLVISYGGVASYILFNSALNGVAGLTYVDNVNLFGKVLEYHMQDLPVNPKYVTIQAQANAYVQKAGNDVILWNYPQLPTQYRGSPGNDWQDYGSYAKSIIIHNLPLYIRKTVPDLYSSWIVVDQSYRLYPAYGYNPQDGLAWTGNTIPGINAYYTRAELVPLHSEPIWTDAWLILSTLGEQTYILLPLIIAALLLWLWRRPSDRVALFLLALTMLVASTIALDAIASFDQFNRLRYPVDWAMFAVVGYVVSQLFGLLSREPVSQPDATPTPGSTVHAADTASEESLAYPKETPWRYVDQHSAKELDLMPNVHAHSDQWPDGVSTNVPARVSQQRPVSTAQDVNEEANRTVIMGAGPAGLTAAYELMRYGLPTVTLEKDPRFVGGISRTEERHGYRFDIGGHRFFSKSQEVEDFWTEILGDEMLTRGRLSRIFYKGKYFDYPLKAGNALLNMGPIETIRCISSYAWARLFPIRNPKSLEDWVTNQFGHRLFSIFFKTYTEKVWGISTKELSADWAAQRIKGLDLTSAIKNALLPQKKAKGGHGAVIKTLIDEFRYPKHGPGEMWERVAERLRTGGNIVALGQEVISIHHNGSRVTSVTLRDIASGRVGDVTGAQFISTLPIRELIHKLEPAMPQRVIAAADDLKYRDFLTVALVLKKRDVFPDNWIYIHDPAVKVGRMQNFKAWSPYMTPDQDTTCIGLEYFCFEGDGLWTSTDDQLVALGTREMAQLGLCKPEDVLWGAVVRQPKAYPVYDDTYKQDLAVIHDYLTPTLPNLHLVGRNGMHHYNNQDHSMMTALLVARNIATGSNYDQWKVNTDAEYHEEARLEDEDTSGRLVPSRVAAVPSAARRPGV